MRNDVDVYGIYQYYRKKNKKQSTLDSDFSVADKHWRDNSDTVLTSFSMWLDFEHCRFHPLNYVWKLMI